MTDSMKKPRILPTERSAPARRGLHIAIAVCLAVLVLLNMAVIFSFSAADREESGNLSAGVTRRVVALLYPDFEDLAEAEQQAILQKAHKFIRKAAHFCEFALLGFLTASLLLYVSHYLKRLRPWPVRVGPAVFTLLYAISDEIHQIFTERGPRVTDVLIDFAGALCGILLIHGLVWLISRCKKRRHRPRSLTRRKKRCKTPATD